MKWSVVIFMPEISSEKPTSICIRARVKKVLWQSTKYCPLTKIRDLGTFRDIKISSADLHPCMARANSCMQCNNPTGSFSFSSFLPFSPFWLLSTIFRWTANQSEDRDRRTIYDSLLQMSSTFPFPLSTLYNISCPDLAERFCGLSLAKSYSVLSWNQFPPQEYICHKRGEVFDQASTPT